jgi:hypothetical protein
MSLENISLVRSAFMKTSRITLYRILEMEQHVGKLFVIRMAELTSHGNCVPNLTVIQNKLFRHIKHTAHPTKSADCY